jgi:hypothetical protein
MEGLGPLSSQLGQRSEEANRRAAERCLANPALLAEVSDGLSHRDAALVGDCAEVMTKVAEVRPNLVAPYAARLAPLLGHRVTRVRWEAMHALALVSGLVPELMAELLPRLQAMIATDASTIVRDYAIDALGHFAASGAERARLAWPGLRESLTAAGGKHAARALAALARVAATAPDLRPDVEHLARPYLNHARGSVRQAARRAVTL